VSFLPEYSICTPLNDIDLAKLKTGDKIKINGIIYTARDAAHKKLIDLINEDKELPIDLNGQIIYYAGPAPAKPGYVIGSIGPTTSGRMDAYTIPLLERGLKGMIGKGIRSEEVKKSIVTNKAIYFAAIGGAAALLSRRVKKCRIIAYPELGPEAIFELEVDAFPVFVINDIYGNDLYDIGSAEYRVNE
jgi:fumarate hydratase subunit beta